MREILLRFSSKNREKSGVSLSHDFTTRFNRPLRLHAHVNHEVAVRTITMTYSWYNIRKEYNNNQFKCSPDKGANWETITFDDGMYSYDDFDRYIKNILREKYHADVAHEDEDKIDYEIQLKFVLSTYRVLITLHKDYRIDLRDGDFRKLIGFESKIVDATEHGDYLPDITRGVDELHIHCDKVTDSIVDGQNSNTIAVIQTEGKTRSFPFSYQPRFLAFSPVSGHMISSMRFYVTDSFGRPVHLNNIDWYIELFLRSADDRSLI